MPISFEIKVDAAKPLLLLRNGAKRMSYAVVNALNNTAKEIQREERARVAAKFVVRKTQFIMRQAAIISPFASVSQGRYFTRIRVGTPRRLLLSEFERGGPRHPFVGKRIAVPLVGGARPSKSAPVPEALWVQKLNLRRAGGGGGRRRRGKGPIRGEQRTYLVPEVGIFQRTGPATSRMLYAFTPLITLDRRLAFVETARRVVNRMLQPELLRQVRATLLRQLMPGR